LKFKPWAGAPSPSTLVRVLLALLVILSTLVVLPSAASAATTGTVYFRGSVTCPEGVPFAGAWVNSSSGKSGWANKTVLPNTSGREAKIGLTISSVALPTTVSLNVGCGTNGTAWKYVYNELGNVKASATGTVFINVGCTTTKCTTAPRGTGGSTSTNPAAESTASTLYGQEWCTYRAAAFWKQMTGSFPGWGGNAGNWDDPNRAPSLGWQVRSWPEPDSLMVWQPTATNRYGHVGYVADVKVENGAAKVKIYDRNWNNRPYDGVVYDRSGEWISIPGGARFIRVPPRFTPYNR
jgi:surface antigen